MADSELLDPKDHIAEFNRLTTHQLQDAAFQALVCR